MKVNPPIRTVGFVKFRNAVLWLIDRFPLSVPVVLPVLLPVTVGDVTVNAKVKLPPMAAPVPVESTVMSPKLELLGVFTRLPVEPLKVSVVVFKPEPNVTELVVARP